MQSMDMEKLRVFVSSIFSFLHAAVLGKGKSQPSCDSAIIIISLGLYPKVTSNSLEHTISD